MLARPEYKTAEELEIHEDLHTALMQVEIDLRSGKLKHIKWIYADKPPPDNSFNMEVWRGNCSTVACIGGWCSIYRPHIAEYIRVKADTRRSGFGDLCYPQCTDHRLRVYDFRDITALQAANAIRNYLTTGDSRWREVFV